MFAAESFFERMLKFDADEYLIIGLRTDQVDANNRVLKLFLNKRWRNANDAIWSRYITAHISENGYSPKRALAKVYHSK